MGRKGNTSKQNKSNKLIFLLSTLVVLCISTIIYLVFFDKKEVADYPEGIIDENVIKVEDNSEKMDKSSGGGAVSLVYSKEVNVDLNSKKVSINFKNPSKSTQSIVLELLVKQGEEDIVLAKTDRIPPGYSIKEMKLNSTVTMEKGKYAGFYNVMYYDEKTEEKAIVNTNIPVEIDVK